MGTGEGESNVHIQFPTYGLYIELLCIALCQPDKVI